VIKQLGWLKVADWIRFRSLQLLYDSLWSTRRYRLPGVSLCNSQRIQVDVVIQPNWADSELRTRACRMWNKLPRNLRQPNGRDVFKNNLRQYLLNL
jgi:hypothetical protein